MVISTTDPDSRNMLTAQGWVQGYNAQAAVNENYIVIAAEATVESPDFGHPLRTARSSQIAAARP